MRKTSLAILALLLAVPAMASPDCMTKREARAKYPRSHLYWSGPRHCWDNRRHPRRIYRDPVFSTVVDASGGMVSKPPPVKAEQDPEPIPMFPGIADPLMRFLPWDNRVQGQVQP